MHRVVVGSLVGSLLVATMACSGGGTDVTAGSGGVAVGQGGLGGAGGVIEGGGGSTFTGGAGPCAPGDTLACYTANPDTLGVGVCAQGERTCDEGTFGPCEGQVTPSKEICNDLDDDCNGAVDDFDGEVVCGLGLCQVTAAGCDSCTPLAPSPTESCDGLDDDCDGIVDNGCPCTGSEKQSCYGGPAGTVGLGECIAGTQICNNGAWGSCLGAVFPSAEACDGIDNDCDGEIDEDCPCTDGDTQPCYGGPSGTVGIGECAGGTQTCVGGAWGDCEGDALPGDEICDGLDNDCDGQVDEGNPEGGASCATGSPGVCANGVEACQGGGIVCVQVGQAGTEICNGLDDDCDGQVDENSPGGGFACPTGQPGACAVGTSTCVGGSISCVSNVAPSTEICNGIDDDCNGQTDEGNPGGGATCSTGQPGACGPGITTCSGGSLICTATTSPTAELCNGVDDDCDGVVDEGNPGGGQSCNTGQPGVCSGGVTACSGGEILCNQSQQPGAEVCNGLDDDCDGQIDEDNPGGGQSCNTGQSGICAAGITACTGGALACNATNSPTAEVCNGVDDDCDGSVDEGNPGGGGACNTGGQGVCAAGTAQCLSGALSCVQSQSPTSEICDGVDNDCDGLVDEGNPGGGVPCSTGLPGVCAMGTTACSGGGIICVPNQSPGAEVCDGIDNDCDGQIDEGDPGGGAACSTGQPGVCGPGTTVCTGGALSCSANQAPSAETCNGLDDDCDGFVDDGNPDGGGACSTGQPGLCGTGTFQCQGAQLVCLQDYVPIAEICANGIDDDCDGLTDESEDLDGDGWGHCDGDCCDSGFCSNTPALINPGAFEVVGNGIDDDCDASTSDTTPAPPCSSTANFTGVTAVQLAQAMDLCQFTTANPPLPQRKWGVITAQQRFANGATPTASQLSTIQNWQSAVLATYGTAVGPQRGATMAGISTGLMRDQNDPNYVSPQEGVDFGHSHSPPAAYLAAHGNSLPASQSCNGSCPAGSGANDSVNLRLQIRVPTNAQSFSYQFKFYTAEYPEWTCTQYNDFYLALLQSAAPGIPTDRNISFDSFNNAVSVNNGFFDVCSPAGCYNCPAGTGQLAGTGMQSGIGGGTVWLTTTAPVVAGETITLELMTFDVSDWIYDSLVLLDDFEWSVTPASVGTVPSD